MDCKGSLGKGFFMLFFNCRMIHDFIKTRNNNQMCYHYFPIKQKKTSIFDVPNLQIYPLAFSPIFKQIKYFVVFFLYFLLEYMIVYLPFFFIYPNIYRNIQQQHNLSIAGLSDLFTDFQFFFLTILFFSGVSNSWKAAGREIKKY